MKKMIWNARAAAVSAVALVLSFGALAPAEEAAAPYQGSKAFERIKGLAGDWKGVMRMDGQDVPITASYKVTSGGSAVVETVFAGTPKEMVTVYHDDAEKRLTMTHYCMLANQPRMTLGKMDKDGLRFDFDPSCGIDVKTAMHMHAMRLKFVDDNTIQHRWTLYQDGASQGANEIILKRVADKG